MAYGYSRSLSLLLGPFDQGTATSSANIDTAFSFETSGDAFAIRFVSPVSQSAATLTVYAFVTAVTGTPSFQVEVREGYSGTGDIDRPKTGGSDIGSSSSTVSSPSANTWVSWTVTCSLTRGDTYWVLVKNTHATPASNHAAFQYRGALDAFSGHGGVATTFTYAMLAGYTTDGFSTDPTVTTVGTGSAVLKFSDGSLLGMPIVSTTSHANNSNNRGIRVTPTEDIVVSGLLTQMQSASISGMAIYQNGNTVLTETGDPSSIASASARAVYRFAPTTLSGGTAYDCVLTFSGSATAGPFYTMGQAEGSVPADVKACLPSWLIGSVDSATASFTPDTSQLMLIALIVDDNPAISGGTTVAGSPLQRGMVS